MRRLSLLLCFLSVTPAWALDGPAPSAGTTAPASASTTAELGEIQVKSIKPLVETLEQMKVAINTPLDNDPKHYDNLVCRLRDPIDGRATGKILDCGTQGWYAMQRTIRERDMNLTEDTSLTTTSTLGHPWHIERLLNFKQLQALRAVLGKLPEPGKGDVQVVLDDPQSAPGGSTEKAPASATTPRGSLRR